MAIVTFMVMQPGLHRSVNLKGTRSFDEVLAIAPEYHHETHPITWILGRGWDQNDWEVKEFPDKSLLDQLFPGEPGCIDKGGWACGTR